MKKLVLVLFGLLLTFGIVGCNSSGSEIDIDLDEFIGTPSNLTISGTVLNWAAVDDADGYIVYANDEEVDKVKTTSFDFGSLEGSRLIFHVRARAPRGMQDSPLSAQVAFVANKDAEIAAANVALISMDINLPEGFSAELVEKGMLGTEVEDLVTGFDEFQTSMINAEGFDSLFTAFDDLLAEFDNIEALVSALVKTMLPEQLQASIDNLNENINMYTDLIEENPDYGYMYEERKVEAEAEKAMLEDLLTQIETDADQLVLAITSTIEYFMSIQAMISEDLIDTIIGLSETEELSDLNVTEMVLVKEEMVTILTETMPTQEDMVLIMEVYELVMGALGTDTNSDTTVENYMGRSAAQSLYSLEVMINFLDTLDLEYFTALKGFYNSDLTEDMASAESTILTIKYFKTFKDDNQGLLDTINEVFTEEEKELLFDEYTSALDELPVDEYEDIYESLKNLNFQTLIYLQGVLEDSFDVLLDAFIDRDGEIVRLSAILAGFQRLYYEDTYVNSTLDIEYDNRSEYRHAEALYNYQLMEEMVYLVNAVVQELNADDYEKVIEVLFDILPVGSSMLYGNITDASSTSMLGMLGVFELVFTTSGEGQLELAQNLAKFMVDEKVFEQLYNLQVSLDTYLKAEFGDDYMSVEGYWDDTYFENAMLILASEFYTEFMTNSNRDLVDGILVEVFIGMLDDDFQSMTDLTDAEVATMETSVGDLLDYISEELDDMKDFDAENLSLSDLNKIENFQMGFEGRLMEISQGAYDQK